jgi:hypothetical protein
MFFHLKRLIWIGFAFAMLCLATGCGAGVVDQTEQANKLVDEMNRLNATGELLSKQAAAKEEELVGRDAEKEGDEIHALAEEQVALYKQAADFYREAAGKAEEASRLKLSDWFKNYLALKGQMFRKLAEVMDAGREGAEVWVNEREMEVIAQKRDQLGERAETLTKEVQEISSRVKQIEEEHKDEVGN